MQINHVALNIDENLACHFFGCVCGYILHANVNWVYLQRYYVYFQIVLRLFAIQIFFYGLHLAYWASVISSYFHLLKGLHFYLLCIFKLINLFLTFIYVFTCWFIYFETQQSNVWMMFLLHIRKSEKKYWIRVILTTSI